MIRKILASLLCLLLAAPLSAQRYSFGGSTSSWLDEHSHYYGLRLGLALGHLSGKTPNLESRSMKAGVNVGGVFGVQISPSAPVYLETGIYFAQKGGKGTIYEDADGNPIYKTDPKTQEKTLAPGGMDLTISVNYLEIPIVAKYFVELDDDLTVQPFFGGYLALGIGGTVKDYLNEVEYTSFSDKYFTRFDGGLRLGCGLQYQVMYAELAYDWGLANISHDTFKSSHTGCLSFNIGVNF